MLKQYIVLSYLAKRNPKHDYPNMTLMDINYIYIY